VRNLCTLTLPKVNLESESISPSRKINSKRKNQVNMHAMAIAVSNLLNWISAEGVETIKASTWPNFVELWRFLPRANGHCVLLIVNFLDDTPVKCNEVEVMALLIHVRWEHQRTSRLFRHGRFFDMRFSCEMKPRVCTLLVQSTGLCAPLLCPPDNRAATWVELGLR
jgi:hypothetical protein